MSPPVAPSRSLWTWILGGSAVIILGMVGCGWYAWKKVSSAMREMAQEYAVVREHIGTIREMTLDVQAAAKAGAPGTMVYRVSGSKGDGRLSFRVDTAGGRGKATLHGTLTMSDGRQFPLDLESEAEPAPPVPSAPVPLPPAPTPPPANPKKP